MAKPIMIQGTMSNAGKSLLTAGLLRVLKQDGLRVAPFKSQNMALNSFITGEGLEMGRAQVMQAEAAGIEPSVLMNPILLKPTNDTGSQVIVNGEVEGVMSAASYFRKKKEYIPAILDAYHKLSKQNDVIVIEGAGSPAEINLKQNDIVNMGMAEMVDAPVLLAGDIDRGGVFAQIYGTVMLLEDEERNRIKGTIINKFRGDKEILRPGLRMLEERTQIPVCGVIPYAYLDIDDEDSLSERFSRKEKDGLCDLAVIRLPRISNFTDFAALEAMPEISVRYVSSPAQFGNPDAVLLPGTKNTIGDLKWLRQNGLEALILKAAERGKLIFGICGGYQMLGKSICDPTGVEQKGEIRGIGLLPTRTVFEEEKTRTQVRGTFGSLLGILNGMSGLEIEGYEIHMGVTTHVEECSKKRSEKDEDTCGDTTGDALVCASYEDHRHEGTHELHDGAQQGNVYGCYIHGIFDAPGIAKAFVQAILKEKGLDVHVLQTMDRREYKEQQYDLLADLIRYNMDMDYIYEVIEKGNQAACRCG